MARERERSKEGKKQKERERKMEEEEEEEEEEGRLIRWLDDGQTDPITYRKNDSNHPNFHHQRVQTFCTHTHTVHYFIAVMKYKHAFCQETGKGNKGDFRPTERSSELMIFICNP